MAKGPGVNQGWGRRLREAARIWAAHFDARLTPVVLAKAFELAPGGHRISRQAMSKWLDGKEPRSLDDVIVLGVVLDQAAGWLAFDEGEIRRELVNPRPVPDVAPTTKERPKLPRTKRPAGDAGRGTKKRKSS